MLAALGCCLWGQSAGIAGGAAGTSRAVWLHDGQAAVLPPCPMPHPLAASLGAHLLAASLGPPPTPLCYSHSSMLLLPLLSLLSEHRRKKAAGNNAAPLPRAVDAERSRTKERMTRELGALGLDASENRMAGCVVQGEHQMQESAQAVALMWGWWRTIPTAHTAYFGAAPPVHTAGRPEHFCPSLPKHFCPSLFTCWLLTTRLLLSPPRAGAAAERAARSQSRRGRSLVRKRGRSEAADADMAAEEQPKKRVHSSKSRCAALFGFGAGSACAVLGRLLLAPVQLRPRADTPASAQLVRCKCPMLTLPLSALRPCRAARCLAAVRCQWRPPSRARA